MKRKITAREFLQSFAKLNEELQPGESVTITQRGHPLGRFLKEPAGHKVPLPDFRKQAASHGYEAAIGDQVLERILRDEAIS